MGSNFIPSQGFSFDLCNHLNNFVNVMKSFFKSGNIENELANNIYNILVNEYQKNECMNNNKK